jgi:hypothetical protein
MPSMKKNYCYKISQNILALVSPVSSAEAVSYGSMSLTQGRCL